MSFILTNLFELKDLAQRSNVICGASQHVPPSAVCMMNMSTHMKRPQPVINMYADLWSIVAGFHLCDIPMTLPRSVFSSDCDAVCAHATSIFTYHALLSLSLIVMCYRVVSRR